MSPDLQLWRVVDRSCAEGPGWRAVVWVQGCSLRCRGCFNTHLWPTGGGRRVDPRALGRRLAGLDGVEGITVLGGEPFDQAHALAILTREVRAADRSVMVFTGYRLEELRQDGPPGSVDLLAQIDLLVDGPFATALPERTRPWVGSTNQRFIHLTPRYRGLDARLADVHDRVEVRVRRDGSVFVNGMAEASRLAAIRRAPVGPRVTR